MVRGALALLGLGLLMPALSVAQSSLTPSEVEAVVGRLVAEHGAAHAARARLGVAQAAARWWAADGDAAAFSEFCAGHFLVEPPALASSLARLVRVLEESEGRLHEIRRELLTPLDLDTGPVSALDELLANVDLGAHLQDDLFSSRVAFFALLNYPLDRLADRLRDGASWSRERWAQSRLMERFAARVPAAVAQEVSKAFTAADQYIARYNIRLDRLVDAAGRRPFPEGLRLITHWGLREEIASQYGQPGGLERQRLIAKVMERIVRQEIPAAAIDNPEVLWNPASNALAPLAAGAAAPGAAREADVRYAKLLEVFRAVQAIDPYDPMAPNWIARKFEVERQIPEAEVERLLTSVLDSPEVGAVAKLVAQRLGRPLEPFDLWYPGLKARGTRSEADLDAMTRQRYPTPEAFARDLPRLLSALGFAAPTADWLASRIVVDPSRGAGHAMGAVRRADRAHLRTRVGAQGMDYKGYDIAVHELGHNVEQVFSLERIDHWPLAGVPNNAFTEALAFVFQDRNLELLGLAAPGEAERREAALATLWATYEIGGVALVDMRVWRWLYGHPQATPAELREATLAIAREVWNRHYAPLFGVRDVELLAIYSHMVVYGLYLPDYPIGKLIAAQVAAKLRGGDFGAEFERIARQGRLTPDLWMRGAVGAPLSAEPLLAAARQALGARCAHRMESSRSCE